MLANVAELGAERMEETIGKAGLRDAAIGTGIAVDKMLALTGQTPAVQIANIVMPPTRSARAPCDARQTRRDRPQARGRTEPDEEAHAHASAVSFLSRTFISLAVADRRVIPIRA